MSGLRGDPSRLTAFAAKLKRLSVVAAQKIASKAAPALTAAAREAYTGGVTVYGGARPGGVSLMRTGATLGALAFVAIGRRVRVQLGTRYAKYLIGKYAILPSGSLPAAWLDDLRGCVNDVMTQEVA